MSIFRINGSTFTLVQQNSMASRNVEGRVGHSALSSIKRLLGRGLGVPMGEHDESCLLMSGSPSGNPKTSTKQSL